MFHTNYIYHRLKADISITVGQTQCDIRTHALTNHAPERCYFSLFPSALFSKIKIYILVSYNFLYRTKPYFPFFLLILQIGILI